VQYAIARTDLCGQPPRAPNSGIQPPGMRRNGAVRDLRLRPPEHQPQGAERHGQWDRAQRDHVGPAIRRSLLRLQESVPARVVHERAVTPYWSDCHPVNQGLRSPPGQGRNLSFRKTVVLKGRRYRAYEEWSASPGTDPGRRYRAQQRCHAGPVVGPGAKPCLAAARPRASLDSSAVAGRTNARDIEGGWLPKPRAFDGTG